MSDPVSMQPQVFTKKTTVIIKFGPATATDGMRPAEYYQVTIDPQNISPSGDFIKFGATNGDEIMGWQRCAALTVIEVLGEWEDGLAAKDQIFNFGEQGVVTIKTVV